MHGVVRTGALPRGMKKSEEGFGTETARVQQEQGRVVKYRSCRLARRISELVFFIPFDLICILMVQPQLAIILRASLGLPLVYLLNACFFSP